MSAGIVTVAAMAVLFAGTLVAVWLDNRHTERMAALKQRPQLWETTRREADNG